MPRLDLDLPDSINDTTVPPAEPLARTGQGPPLTKALVILACTSEPHRAGEVAYLPEDGSVLYVGRGDEEPETRAAFHPQQPGKHPIAAPLRGRGLSRLAAAMRLGREGVLFERVGSSPMLVNGEAVEKGELVPGHVMQFPGELSLLCVARARTMAPHEYFPADALGDFGEPDAYGMIGESAAMQALRESIARDAASANHVLLLGESGTGKELAARAIHALSDRRRRALVACNAGSVPPKLVYTEFFGNLRDYPNAGMPARIGYFATADKAFLFVDEILELPIEAQSALLRAFAFGGEYNRVGEPESRTADVRVVGATNGNPNDETKMRGDLRARFAIISASAAAGEAGGYSAARAAPGAGACEEVLGGEAGEVVP